MPRPKFKPKGSICIILGGSKDEGPETVGFDWLSSNVISMGSQRGSSSSSSASVVFLSSVPSSGF